MESKIKPVQCVNGSVLYITEYVNVKEDPCFFIPRYITKKRGLNIISNIDYKDCVTTLKTHGNNIRIIIVNANNEERIRSLAKVLKVIIIKNSIPVLFIAELFTSNLQNFLVNLGFVNFISLSTSSAKELVATFDSAFKNMSNTQQKPSVDQRRVILSDLRDIKSLPPLPDIYFKVENLSRNSNSTPGDFSKILEFDTAITAKLIRMSNSAYYGFKRKIKTVKDAVTLLGTKQTISLVRLACITNNLKVSPNVEKVVKNIWQHSAACAISSQLVFNGMNLSNKEELIDDILICAILHDIGKIVLLKFFPEKYLPIALKCKNNSIPTENDEKKYLGISHAEVGKTLAEHWQFPNIISEVIAYHHNPTIKPNSELISIIHIADIISKLINNDMEVEEPFENKGYSKEQVLSMASDFESDIKEKTEHVTNMICG